RVADAVDHAGSPERNPDHLNAPDRRADEEAEQVDVDGEHHEDARPIQRREEMALDPIVRGTLAVLLEHTGLADRLAVIEGALEQDLTQAFDERRVRIAL